MVHEFNVRRPFVGPAKAGLELVIDPDAELSPAATFQRRRWLGMSCAKVASNLTSDPVANLFPHGSFIEQFFQTIACDKAARGEFTS